MNELNKIYEAMLKSWNTTLTSDAQLMLLMGGQEHPVRVDDKFVYLPTSDNLNGVTIGKVFFHPACESIMSKETEIFKVIRKLTVAKIYSIFQPIASVLFTVASKKSGKTLSSKMLEQLEPFKLASKETRDELIELVKTVSVTLEGTGVDTRLINWNLIKGGKDENERHIYYTATPSFPFHSELSRYLLQNPAAERITFAGTTVSRAAAQLMIHLLEMAFPAINDPSSCSYSTTSPDAARLIAYLNSYALVASGLNSLIGKYRKDFDAIGIYGIELSWSSDLDMLPELKGLVPPLDYNNHNVREAQPRQDTNQMLNSVLNTNSQQPQQQYVQPQQQQSRAPNPPIQPSPRGSESYVGVDYLENGLFEYRYRQTDGSERVSVVDESGRFIQEYVRPAGFQQQQTLLNALGMNLNTLMTPQVTPGNLSQAQLLQLALQLNQQKSGIPPIYGIGVQPVGGTVAIDPYTHQPVYVQPQQQQSTVTSPMYGINTQPVYSTETPGMSINNY